MKTMFLLLATAVLALANTAPSVVIQSASMRAGTTLMDVIYRVNDPDDATVKVRALAFVDGVRSFSNVIRPVTFVEGTAAKLGDAIPANVDHTLTWDVGADWDVDLGQVKFEVLSRDARGLLAFDWISIPAAGGKPALTISKDAPSDASVLSALFWQYADGDSSLTLSNGLIIGTASSGVFQGITLASGASLQTYSIPYLLKKMNLDPAGAGEVNYAALTARAGLLSTTRWHAVQRPYQGFSPIFAWGSNTAGQTTIARGVSDTVTAIAAGGSHSLALMSDGTVVGWGSNVSGQTTIPAGLTGVTAIAAGGNHSLALKSDGTVVAWGSNSNGQRTIPAGLTGVTSISASSSHSLALKSDGTVVAWGNNQQGQVTGTANPTPPHTSVGNPVTLNGNVLTGVTAIAAGSISNSSLALKSNGTVVGWGNNSGGQITIPAGLTGVIAIATGTNNGLALKNDGTLVAWGNNFSGQTTIPAGLNGVTAIAAGAGHSLALKSDGVVVAWGGNQYGEVTGTANPVSPYTSIANPVMFNGVVLTGVTAIAAGYDHSILINAKAP